MVSIFAFHSVAIAFVARRSKSREIQYKTCRTFSCIFFANHSVVVVFVFSLFSVCQAGNWKCSSNGCESTCSVWGDSHFTTFDQHDFDFQGACDYVLSKGMASNGDGFTITIQNVLCGTMGVTCSKSVEIALTGSVQDTLILSSDASYLDIPNKSTINSKLRTEVTLI